MFLQEITGLKGEIALLRRALEDSKKRNTEVQAQHEGTLFYFLEIIFCDKIPKISLLDSIF